MNAEEIKDYYGLLGIPQAATISEIHKAYWRKASRSHPDRGGNHETMVRLVEAWKILSDPEKRSRYDQLLRYRHDGWQSRKFDTDVKDARKGAEVHASRSWSEFEEVYQKAFYTFNQDFYGEDVELNAAGPYSPLMVSEIKGSRSEGASKTIPSDSTVNNAGVTIFAYIMKTVILFAAIVAALFFYSNYGGIGRYVPPGQPDASTTQIVDTTTGAVYSVEKRFGNNSP